MRAGATHHFMNWCVTVQSKVQPLMRDDQELPVEGCTSLQQSLDAYLQPEELTGDNQYACSVCGRKTDAQRAAQITEAPEVFIIAWKEDLM